MLSLFSKDNKGRKYLVSTGANPDELLEMNFEARGLMYNQKFAYVCYHCGSYNELPENEQERVLEKFRNDMGLNAEQHGKMKDCQNKKGGGGDVKIIGEILKQTRRDLLSQVL